MERKQDPDYFKLPKVSAMILIAFGMTLTAMCVYVPWKIPYRLLGFIGDIAWYFAYHRPRLIKAIWYMAVTIHVSEAIYAYYLAGRKGIRGTSRLMWFIFTLAFGIGSLRNLLKYNPNAAVGDFLTEVDNDKEHNIKSLSKFVSAIEGNDGDIAKKPLITSAERQYSAI